MTDHELSRELSHLMNYHVDNLHACAMSENFPDMFANVKNTRL